MKNWIPQALGAAAAAVLLAATPGQAQERPFEISLDGGFVYTSYDVSESLTRFVLPFRQARMSVYVAPQVAVEGSFLFDYRSQDDASVSELLLAPGISYYFAPFDAGENRTYVSGLIAYNRVGFDTGLSDGSESQWGLGGRIGTKVPVGEVGFVRLEGGYTYLMENEDAGLEAASRFDLTVGLGGILN